MNNRKFADFLTGHGIPCKMTDVENDSKKPFKPHNCPPTQAVCEALNEIKITFPRLQVDMFIVESDTIIDLTVALKKTCPFLERT